ncbi:MAG: extracellular solute-binding protein [Candidatus Izemoplasma sp.]
MKKVSLALLLVLIITVLGACGDSETNDSQDIVEDSQDAVGVYSGFTTDPITISFWNNFYGDAEDLLDVFIDEFKLMYPNITIENSVFQYTTNVASRVLSVYPVQQEPTMVATFSSHLAELNGLTLPLDEFINDENYGINHSDFITDFVNESKQFEGGKVLSLPVSKYTEILVINKDKFVANGLEIKTDEPYTWDELDTLASILVGDGPDQCEYLINYDKPAHLFTTGVAQWDAGFTDSQGSILIDNPNTILMLESIRDKFSSNTFAIPLIWRETYGSESFKAENVCMSVIRPAALVYYQSLNDAYEIEIGMLPQYDLDNLAYHQAGVNIAILNTASDDEALAAWLFTSYMTNTENAARWALAAKSVPVRYSAFSTTIYTDFLNDPRPEDIYLSNAAYKVYLQIDDFIYIPSFDQRALKYNAPMLLEQAEYAIEAASREDYTIEQIIGWILEDLE